MAKKVIKQTYQTNIDIESFTADNITISQHGTMTSDEVVIEKSKATEVAKAIDEKYQKTIDELEKAKYLLKKVIECRGLIYSAPFLEEDIDNFLNT